MRKSSRRTSAKGKNLRYLVVQEDKKKLLEQPRAETTTAVADDDDGKDAAADQFCTLEMQQERDYYALQITDLQAVLHGVVDQVKRKEKSLQESLLLQGAAIGTLGTLSKEAQDANEKLPQDEETKPQQKLSPTAEQPKKNRSLRRQLFFLVPSSKKRAQASNKSTTGSIANTSSSHSTSGASSSTLLPSDKAQPAQQQLQGVEEAQQALTSLWSSIDQLQDERGNIKSKLETLQTTLQRHESEALNLVQSLSAERDQLALKSSSLDQQLESLQGQQQQERAQRKDEDQQIIATMRMMQDYIYKIEEENNQLTMEQCCEVETKKEAWLLQEETNANLQGRIEELQAERERLDIKCQSQADALLIVINEEKGEEESNPVQTRLLSQQQQELEAIKNTKKDTADIIMSRRIQRLEESLAHLNAKAVRQSSEMVLLEHDKQQLLQEQAKQQHIIWQTITNKQEQEQEQLNNTASTDETTEQHEEDLRLTIAELEDEVDSGNMLCQCQLERILRLEQQLSQLADNLASAKASIEQLETERDQLRLHVQTQTNKLPQPRSHNKDDQEQDEEQVVYTMQQMKEYMEDLEIVKQKIASKSCSRESAIAMLEEQNDLKDARLGIMETMVKSLIAERNERWTNKIFRLKSSATPAANTVGVENSGTGKQRSSSSPQDQQNIVSQ